MTAPEPQLTTADVLTQLNATLNSQKQSYLAEGAVSAEVRMDRLDRALDILVRHAERISEAMNADFVCPLDRSI